MIFVLIWARLVPHMLSCSHFLALITPPTAVDCTWGYNIALYRAYVRLSRCVSIDAELYMVCMDLHIYSMQTRDSLAPPDSHNVYLATPVVHFFLFF